MSSKRWKRFERLSSWRKISVGMWGAPDDPTIYGFDTLDVTDTLPYLEEVSQASGVKVTMTALVVACAARTLAENPEMNAIILGPKVLQRTSVDAFCQVAVPNERLAEADLSGVKLADVDKLDLVEIARRLGGKAEKLRQGQDKETEKTKSQVRYIPPRLMRGALKVLDALTYGVPADLDSVGVRSDPFGSFMVTSVAQFGIKQGFAPIVPMAHCPLIFLPGCVHDVPMVIDGEVKARKGITISCTFDHRVYDGLQIGVLVKAFEKLVPNVREHFPPPEHWAQREGSGESGEERAAGSGSRTPESGRRG